MNIYKQSIPICNGRAVVANTTLLPSDDVLDVNATSGAVTITLPTAASVLNTPDGDVTPFYITKIDASANPVTLQTSGGDTISGGASYNITGQFSSVIIFPRNSKWSVFGASSGTGSSAIAIPVTPGTATGPTTTSFNAGYTTNLGDLVYLSAAGTWLQANATTLANYSSMLAIVLSAGVTSGNPLMVALAGSFVYMTTFPALTIGAPAYVSATNGAITQSQPTTTNYAIRVVGFGVAAQILYFNPSDDYITHA